MESFPMMHTAHFVPILITLKVNQLPNYSISDNNCQKTLVFF